MNNTFDISGQKRRDRFPQLNISPYYSSLDIEGFSLMMKDPSYCYKFYWLEAIVRLIAEDVRETTFSDIIDEMIVSAWYSVLEFHIHLSGMVEGEVRDGLERAVLRLKELSGLPPHASKTEIKNALREHTGDRELYNYKEQLTHMVPYRALAGFFGHQEERADWGSARRMAAYIERVNEIIPLPYTLGTESRLARKVYFNDSWVRMIQDHTVSILGWIQYEKVRWLQNNNPEVPGLVYKLAPMDERMRKLSAVRKLWDEVMSARPIEDIFRGIEVDRTGYDIDHFIPWSFVMNDELWNLMPTDPGYNSQKSNKLPRWDPFFKTFAANQFVLYELIHDEGRPLIRRRFEACYRDNLHSIWASEELYRMGHTREEFTAILEQNMRPVYDSARRQGYEIWSRAL